MRKWFRSGIYRRILLSILVVSLVSLIILGGFALYSTKDAEATATSRSTDALDDKAAEALELRAIETANDIARFLEEREADLRMLASLPPTAETYLNFDANHRGELWFVEAGQEVRRREPLYQEIVYIDASGQEVLKVENGQVAPPEALRDVSDPANTLYQMETYFAEAGALEPGEIYVSHVTGYYVSRAAFEAGERFSGILRFAMPVFTPDGSLDGVIALALDSRHLEEFTTHIVPTKERFAVASDHTTGNYAYIIDDLSHVISHPDDAIQWGVGNEGQSLPYAKQPDEIGVVPVQVDRLGFVDENLASIHGIVMQGEAGSIQYYWAGLNKFVAFAPIPYYGGPYEEPGGFGWVGFGADVNTFHEAATLVGGVIREKTHALVLTTSLILALTTLAVLAVAGLLAQYLTAPIVRLTEAAHAVEQGEFPVSLLDPLLERAADDEVTKLATTFRQMVRELEKTMVALRESEERYRTLFEGVPTGIYRSTPAGQIIDANPAMVQMLGYPDKESLLSVNAVDHYINAEDRQRWKSLLESGEVVPDFEVQFHRYDGAIIWVRNNAHAVRDDKGRVLYYEGSLENTTTRKQAEEELRRHRDHLEELVEERTTELQAANEQLQEEIAERGRAEAALKRSETRYRALFEQARDAIFLENEQEEIVDANPAASQLFGYTHAELLAMKTEDLQPEEERTGVMIVKPRFEVTGQRRDGTLMTLDITLASLSDEEEELYLSIVRDITERKQMEEELRESEERIRALVNALPDLVFVFDRDGQYVEVFETHRQLIVYPETGMLKGSHVHDVLPEDVADRFMETIVRTIETGEPQDLEYQLDVEAGTRWFGGRTAPLPGAEGREKRVIWIARDITDRKQVEGEREQLIDELDAYAHTVAHDLKNPLGVIVGFGGVLEGSLNSMTEEQGLCVNSILDSALKMSNIIDALLLLASVRKIDEVEMKRLDVARLVEETRLRLEPMFQEHQVEMIRPDTWPEAMGYALWVEEVWTNYISNAIKYGGRPPRVELGADVQPDGMVRFWVRDNGPGLTEEERAQLFTPFTRLEQAQIEGYGLGLSIVQRIVEKLGGQVGVDSQPGEGSCFWFTLPAA